MKMRDTQSHDQSVNINGGCLQCKSLESQLRAAYEHIQNLQVTNGHLTDIAKPICTAVECFCGKHFKTSKDARVSTAREICRKMKYDDAYLYVDFIAAALEAERKAGREEGTQPDQARWFREGWDMSRQAALEEAAEIVQKAAALLPEDLYRQKEAMEIIAQRIRNLQAERR